MAKHRVAITDRNGKSTHVWRKIQNAFTKVRQPSSTPPRVDDLANLTADSIMAGDVLVHDGTHATITRVFPSDGKVRVSLSDGTTKFLDPTDSVQVGLESQPFNSNNFKTTSKAIEAFEGIYRTNQAYGVAGALEAIREMEESDITEAILVGAEQIGSGTKVMDQGDREKYYARLIDDINDHAAENGRLFGGHYAEQIPFDDRVDFLYFLATIQENWD